MKYMFLFVLPSLLFAGSSLKCTQIKETSISWEKGSYLAEARNSVKKPLKVELFLMGKTPYYKTNTGVTNLVFINKETYIEKTGSGNLFTWKLLISTDGEIHASLQKAYVLAKPVVYSIFYRCYALKG